jgi:hypothetical protein
MRIQLLFAGESFEMLANIQPANRWVNVSEMPNGIHGKVLKAEVVSRRILLEDLDEVLSIEILFVSIKRAIES